jgi:hypothetical protein
MKKLALCLMLAVVSLCLAVFPAASAPIIVPGYGDTGWQTYSHEFTSDWRGMLGIGVSNYGDMEMDSKLLVGNLNIGPPGNTRFETGDFSGYTVYGHSNAVVSQQISYSGGIYIPNKESYMAMLLSSYYYDDTTGWTDYVDTSEWGGTNGAYISFQLDVTGGTTLIFDWAFLAGDEYPNADFAFVFGEPKCGGPVLTSCETFGARPMLSGSGDCPQPYFEKIAEIGKTVSVPEPPMAMLLVCSLIGIAGLRKKFNGLSSRPSQFL